MKMAPSLAAAVAFACACAGCAVDTDRARVCRSIVPALNASDAVLEIVSATALPRADGVRIAYRVQTSAAPLNRFVECRFAAGDHVSPDRERLVGVSTEAGALGEVRLHMLKRFWLEREGAAADPEPVANASQAPALPRPLAIGLQHVVAALPPIAIYGLLAAAYSLVYGLVGRINLAFGELAAVGGYATFLAFALVGTSPGAGAALTLALLLALTSTLSYGVAVSRLVFAPLMRLTGQQVLIGTIALAIVLQEALRLMQGAKPLWVRPLFNTPHAIARSGDFVVTVTPVAMAAVLLCLIAVLALLVFMRASRFGRAWRACADDPVAAALFGVDRGAVLLETFALASLLAGLAGYVVTVYYGTFGYAGGIVLGLKALLVAVAGGIGSVPGAFLGGILLGFSESLWSALFPIEFRDVAVFCLLVAFLVLRPNGLFGLSEPLQPKV